MKCLFKFVIDKFCLCIKISNHLIYKQDMQRKLKNKAFISINLLTISILKEKYLSCFFWNLGGGGCGKSYLNQTLAMWIDHILRKKEDDLDRPKVLLLAFTGVAASIIGDSTIYLRKDY